MSGLDLNLPADGSTTTVNKLLIMYFKTESRPLQCDTLTCENHTKIPRPNLKFSRKLEAAPDMLCLRLMRFTQIFDEEGEAYNSKDPRRVSFPKELNMTRFVQNTFDPAIDVRENDLPKYSYSLYAVVTQCGELDYGHYKAYVKVNGKWWEHNDDVRTKVTQAVATTQVVATTQPEADEFTPYMLFYERAIRT